jgi:hypothetical protein
MKATPQTVTVALDLYFKGISMRAIVDHIKQFYGTEVLVMLQFTSGYANTSDSSKNTLTS